MTSLASSARHYLEEEIATLTRSSDVLRECLDTATDQVAAVTKQYDDLVVEHASTTAQLAAARLEIDSKTAEIHELQTAAAASDAASDAAATAAADAATVAADVSAGVVAAGAAAAAADAAAAAAAAVVAAAGAKQLKDINVDVSGQLTVMRTEVEAANTEIAVGTGDACHLM